MRNVPERIYREICNLAGAEGRSLNAAVIALLDQALNGRRRCEEQGQILAEIDQHRFTPSRRPPTAETLVRKDRDR